MYHVSCNDFGFLCSFWVEYQISHSPHFGAIWKGFQTVYSGPEVNKLERGLKPTETYVSKDSGGLGVWCVWTTYSWRCQCGGRQWERQKSNIFRWLAKQQLCTYCTTDDVKMPNFTFVENANKWQSTFFSLWTSILFEGIYLQGNSNSRLLSRAALAWILATPLYGELARRPKFQRARAHSNRLSFGSGGSRPSNKGGTLIQTLN